MSVELRLLDQIKLLNHLTRNFVCGYSEDDRFFILTETGVYILGLKCNLSWVFPDFSCMKNFIQLSNFVPASNVDLDINTFHKDLDRKALYESVMASEYSASLKHIKPLDPSPICAEWSPAGVVQKSFCLLGVLTNTHSLEIYLKYMDESEQIVYIMILNLTNEIISVQRNKWKDPTRFSIPFKLEEFKNRVNSVSVSAFTWTHLFEVDGKIYCAIIAGLLNGDITVWRLQELNEDLNKDIKLYFLGRYATQLKRITTMHWHSTSRYGGGLSFGDVQGKVNILRIANLNEEIATIDEEFGLWTEDDKLSVDKITVVMHENRTYILVIKQNVLVIFGMNEEGVFFDQKVEHMEDYYITGVHQHKNVVTVLSLTGNMTQFTISGKRAGIVITRRKVTIKADIQQYYSHGFFFTTNRVLCGILLFPKSLQQFTTLRTNLLLYIFNNSYLNPVEILWNNPTDSLRTYWDCFEAIRIICLKEKRFPWIDLPSDLIYDDLSLVQLKTLRYIAKLSETVFSIVPRIESYNIKPYILITYLVEIKLIVARMKKLFSQKASGNDLSVFQMRSLDVQNFFLKEMVVKNVLANMNVGMTFVKEIKEVLEIANELEYPEMNQCVWCGEKLLGPSCLPPHTDSRCCFTMMPIFFIPSYKCSVCRCVAHREVRDEISTFICPFCDFPMDNIPVDSKELETAALEFYIDCEGEVKSSCFDDCLNKEDLEIRYEDIEENENEFIIFSDSDDENEEDSDKLRTMYFKMAHCSLNELINYEANENDVSKVEGEPSKKHVKMDGHEEETGS